MRSLAAVAAATSLVGCGAAPSEQMPARTGGGAGASVTAPPELPLLRRPATVEDQLPPYAEQLGVALAGEEARRLRTSPSGDVGVWLGPAQPVAGSSAGEPALDASNTCMQAVLLSGVGRGAGGLSCAPTSVLRRDRRLLVALTRKRDGLVGVSAPRDAIVAGLVPPRVGRVRLHLRGGATIEQRVQQGAFVFRTAELVDRLTYRMSGRVVRVNVRDALDQR